MEHNDGASSISQLGFGSGRNNQSQLSFLSIKLNKDGGTGGAESPSLSRNLRKLNQSS